MNVADSTYTLPTIEELKKKIRFEAALSLQVQSELMSSYANHLENKIDNGEIESAWLSEYRNKAADSRNIASLMCRAAELELTQ